MKERALRWRSADDAAGDLFVLGNQVSCWRRRGLSQQTGLAVAMKQVRCQLNLHEPRSRCGGESRRTRKDDLQRLGDHSDRLTSGPAEELPYLQTQWKCY